MEKKPKPAQEEKIMEPSTSRRSLLKGLAVGAGAGTIGAELLNAGLLNNTLAHAQGTGAAITNGDVAIIRFLAAVEIIETDLWRQYNELGGIQDSEVPGGSGSPGYIAALAVLDADMSQYIHDNTEDEISHFTFLNALGNQVGVEEREVADLILGIVVDVLGHVRIQHCKGSDVAWTPAPPWDFAVLDASQFVVLAPQIGFDDFDRSQEPENGHVSIRKRSACPLCMSESIVQ